MLFRILNFDSLIKVRRCEDYRRYSVELCIMCGEIAICYENKRAERSVYSPCVCYYRHKEANEKSQRAAGGRDRLTSISEAPGGHNSIILLLLCVLLLFFFTPTYIIRHLSNFFFCFLIFYKVM